MSILRHGNTNRLRVYKNEQINNAINSNTTLRQNYKFRFKMQLSLNSTRKRKSYSRQITQTQLVLQELSCEEIDRNEKQEKKAVDIWTKEQEYHFLTFWMRKITANPLRMYSDNLLKRSQHFQQLSCFLLRKLGAEKTKDEQQCKNKFGKIKRKIKQNKLKGRRPHSYCFVDYLIKRGRAISEHFPPLQKTIAELEKTVNTDSDFMQLTKRLSDFQDQIIVKRKNNEILSYLKELQNQKQGQE